MVETKELKPTKQDVNKCVDPFVVGSLAIGAVAAYPGAKELARDVRKVIQKT